MSEPATLPEHLPPSGDAVIAADAMLELEHRVHRLENAVADLKDTQALEERVTENVTARLRATAAGAHDDRITTERPRRGGEQGRDFEDDRSSLSRGAPAREPWLLVDMIGSLRLLWRMLLDRRH